MAATTIAAYIITTLAIESAIAIALVNIAVSVVTSIIVSQIFNRSPGDGGGGYATGADPGIKSRLPVSPENKTGTGYGNFWVKGAVIHGENTSDFTTAYYVVALSESISGFANTLVATYWQEFALTLGNDGWVTNAVDAGGNMVGDFNNFVRVQFFANGLPTDRSSLPNTTWFQDNTKLMSGYSCVVVTVKYNRDKQIYNLQDMTFNLMNGLSAPGSVIRDYMTNTRYGGGLDPSLVDTVSLTALDNYSAQLLPFTAPDGTTQNAPRYQINGIVNSNNDCWTNIEELARCAGSSLQAQNGTGKFGVFIDMIGTQVATLSDNQISARSTITLSDFTTVPNQLVTSFSDGSSQYKGLANNFTYKTPSNLLPATAPVVQQQTSYAFVNNSVQAQRLAILELNQWQLDVSYTFICDHRVLGLQSGDVIAINDVRNNWQQKLFRIASISEQEGADGSLTVELVTKEYSDAIYTDRVILAYNPAPNLTGASPRALANVTPPPPFVTNPVYASATPNFTINQLIPTTVNMNVDQIEIYFATLNADGSVPSDTQFALLTTIAIPASGITLTAGTTQTAIISSIKQATTNQVFYFKSKLFNSLFASNISGISNAFIWNPTAADVQVFDTSGIWTKPKAGQRYANVQLWGAGGGGGDAQVNANQSFALYKSAYGLSGTSFTTVTPSYALTISNTDFNLFRSSDGLGWVKTGQTFPNAQYLTYANNRLLIIDFAVSNVIRSSIDNGITFTTSPTFGVNRMQTLAYSSTLNLYVIGGTDPNVYYTSSDLNVFTGVNLPAGVPALPEITRLEWSSTFNLFFMLVAGGALFTSSNGTTWARAMRAGSPIVQNGEIAVATNVVVVSPNLYTTNGTTWNLGRDNANLGSFQNKVLSAVGDPTGVNPNLFTIQSTTDGVNWLTENIAPILAQNGAGGPPFAFNNAYLATGGNELYYYSATSSVGLYINPFFFRIAGDGNNEVIVLSSNYPLLYRTTDAINFEEVQINVLTGNFGSTTIYDGTRYLTGGQRNIYTGDDTSGVFASDTNDRSTWTFYPILIGSATVNGRVQALYQIGSRLIASTATVSVGTSATLNFYQGTSSDLTLWSLVSTLTIPNTTVSFFGLGDYAFTQTIYLVNAKQAADNQYYRSTDLITWTLTRGTGIPAGTSISAIGVVNNFFYLSLDNGNTYRSSDGSTWVQTTGVSISAVGIAFNGGQYVASNARSIDGLAWTNYAGWTAGNSYWTGSQFLGASGNNILLKSSGTSGALTFVNNTLSFNAATLNYCESNSSSFAAIANPDYNPFVVTQPPNSTGAFSRDARTWYANADIGTYVTNIVVSNNVFVTNSTRVSSILTSFDGVTWINNPLTINTPTGFRIVGSFGYLTCPNNQNVVYATGFITMGTGPFPPTLPAIFKSSNLTTWDTLFFQNPATFTQFEFITFNPVNSVALITLSNVTGGLLYSNDGGMTFNPATAPASFGRQPVAVNDIGTVYAYTSPNGRIFQSPDGLNWNINPNTGNFFRIKFVNGLWWGLGANAATGLQSSPDLVTWTTYTNADGFKDIAYNQNLGAYVALSRSSIWTGLVNTAPLGGSGGGGGGGYFEILYPIDSMGDVENILIGAAGQPRIGTATAGGNTQVRNWITYGGLGGISNGAGGAGGQGGNFVGGTPNTAWAGGNGGSGTIPSSGDSASQGAGGGSGGSGTQGGFSGIGGNGGNPGQQVGRVSGGGGQGASVLGTGGNGGNGRVIITSF